MVAKKNQLRKIFGKVDIVHSEIQVLLDQGQYVSAFVLKFMFLEQFLELFVSIVYLQLNRENATELVALMRDDMSNSTFGHKVMHLMSLNKQFKLGLPEPLLRQLQKISSFRNKTVHRLLHADVDIESLNLSSKKWLKEMDAIHDQLFVGYLASH
jgi:hypothetical protein